MNNILLLKEYLIKEDEQHISGVVPHTLMDMTNIPESTLKPSTPNINNPTDVPPQYRKYLKSFPGGKLPKGLDLELHQGSKGGQYIDTRDATHDQKDDVLAPNPDLPTSYGGIIFNDKGEILVRSPKGDGYGNKWTMAKGSPNPDEHAHQTALREVEEETGMKCDILHEIPGYFEKDGKSNNKYYAMEVIDDSGMDFESDETSKIEWMNPKDAMQAFANGDDKDSAHRDIAALHMALHEREKRGSTKVNVDDFNEFSKKADESSPDNIVDIFDSFKDHIYATNGHLPDEFLENARYKPIRDMIKYSFLYPNKSGTHMDSKLTEVFGTGSGQAGNIATAIKNVLHAWTDDFGSLAGGVPNLVSLHKEFSQGFIGSHQGQITSLINDVAGEMLGVSDQFVGGVNMVNDVGVDGKSIWRSPENRNEIVKAHEAWQKGGDASGTLSSGEEFDFEGEKTVPIKTAEAGSQLGDVTEETTVSPWVYIAEHAKHAKDNWKNHKNHDGEYIQNKLYDYGTNIANSLGYTDSDIPEGSDDRTYKIDLGRNMARKYFEIQKNINKSLLDCVTTENYVTLYRGFSEAQEVGGHIPFTVKSTGQVSFAESTYKALTKAGMTDPQELKKEPVTGFETYTHSRPVSGYSVKLSEAENFAGYSGYIQVEQVAKDRVISLPIERPDDLAHEKEVFVLASPNQKVRLYHSPGKGTDSQIARNDKYKLHPNGAGWEMEGSFPASVGTETPHGTFHHGVDKPNAKNEDIYTPTGEVLGETSGGVYHDKDNNKFYIKTNDQDQNAVEQLSNTLYKAAGINVADSELINWKGNPALKSSWIPGAKYFGQEGDPTYTPAELENHPDIHQGFLMDCLLANWDVAGTGTKRPYGNIVQGDDGKMYRIDMGGSLYKSGLGNTKHAFFGHTDQNKPLQELDSMKDGSINAQAAHLFTSMPTDALKDSFKAVLHATNSADAVHKLVDESGIKDQNKDSVINALITRRNSINNWMKDNHGELHDAAYAEYMSERSLKEGELIHLNKAEYKTDPKIAWLKQQPEFIIDDFHRDSSDERSHNFHAKAKTSRDGIIKRLGRKK